MTRPPPRSTRCPYTTLFRSPVAFADDRVDRRRHADGPVGDEPDDRRVAEIGRAVQQECRDRYRMPSYACDNDPAPDLDRIDAVAGSAGGNDQGVFPGPG